MALRTDKKRRNENKTDYNLRFGLLKSGKPRIVIRRTNKYFIVQAVESFEGKDKVISGVTSRDLIKQGWDKKFEGSLKNISAGYLTGLLAAKKFGDKEFIVDLGMTRTIDGNRMFAVVKGLADGGANINVNERVFPSEERINGEHLKDELKLMISKLKTKLMK